MKTTKLLMLISACLLTFSAIGQIPRIGVLNIESQGVIMQPSQLGDLVRIELGKLKIYDVIDRFEINELIRTNPEKFEECYSRSCMLEAASELDAHKIFNGSIQRFGEKLIFTFRIFDASMESVEKSQVFEFVNVQPEIQNMIGMAIAQMHNLPIDSIRHEKLTNKHAYESAITSPGINKINASGPRMGFMVITGTTGQRLQASDAGGFDVYPVLTHFGYQFEVQYLNEGRLQALMEIIPTITGIDQGLFIPGFSILNGFRNNVSGWEFAFGPTFRIARIAEGYYDNSGNWQLRSTDPEGRFQGRYQFLLDKRGELDLGTGFILAGGKTFKSGDLNIPVNVYIIPSKAGWRVGSSFGFNAK